MAGIKMKEGPNIWPQAPYGESLYCWEKKLGPYEYWFYTIGSYRFITPDDFNYTDETIRNERANGQLIRGHILLWNRK